MPRRWRIALLLGIGVLVNYLDRVNLSVSEAALHAEFGLSQLTFGYLLGAFGWTYAAMQLPVGVILDRFGVKAVGRLSALWWSIASFCAALANGLPSLFAARLLLGVGESPTFPGNAKAIGYWFPESERSFATALFDAAAKLGPALSAPLVGVLLLHFGWRWSFACTGLVSLLYFLLFYRVYRNPSEDKFLTEGERRMIAEGGGQAEQAVGAECGVPLAYLLRNRKVIGLSVGFAAYNYTFYLLLTWLPSYLSTSMHVDLLHSVFYTSVPFLLATATDLAIGGWLVDRLVRSGRDASSVRRTVLIVGTTCGLGILGAADAHTPGTALFWISLSIGGLAAAAPVGWSIPALIAPRNSVGRVAGILNFFSQLAGVLAPIVTGHIASITHSFYGAFATAGVFVFVGVLSYLFLLGRIEPIPELKQ